MSPKDQERIEAAVAWWTRLQKDESAFFSVEFQEWIAIPANEREFQAVEFAARLPRDFITSPSIARMYHAARKRFERGENPGYRLSWRMAWAAVVAIVLLAVAAGGYLHFAGQPRSYQTAVGERRAVALEDGSRILLDSNSEVDVRYSRESRAVVLMRGRARFDVAHNTARPFSVAAGGETVIAVGTAFDVEIRGSKVLVTLIQGRVLIEGVPDNANHNTQPGAPLRLSAGQQLVVSAGRKPAITPADFSVTQAWETGHLVFRGERLADAVQQINRYTDHPIIVDPSAASYRVIGVFNTGDTNAFISAETELYPIEAVSDANGAIKLQRLP